MEVVRAQYSINSAYEESREGLSQLSHLTPVNGKNNRFNRKLSPNSCFVLCIDQSSSLFSIPGSYEFEMTSTQRYRFTLCTHMHIYMYYTCFI